jgi:hypothetical protein
MDARIWRESSGSSRYMFFEIINLSDRDQKKLGVYSAAVVHNERGPARLTLVAGCELGEFGQAGDGEIGLGFDGFDGADSRAG